MLISVDIAGRVAKVRVEGAIDVTAAPLFHSKMASIDIDGIDRIEMDFSQVGYISSSALRELLILKKRLGEKQLFIDRVRPAVDEIIRITGFNLILDYSVLDTTADQQSPVPPNLCLPVKLCDPGPTEAVPRISFSRTQQKGLY